MGLLPDGWRIRVSRRPASGSKSTSYAWADGDRLNGGQLGGTATFFWTWALLFFHWLWLHEIEGHARAWNNGWPIRDCGSRGCVMAEAHGWGHWWTCLKHRLREGTWYCPECGRRRRERAF